MHIAVYGSAPNDSMRGLDLDRAMDFLDRFDAGTLGDDILGELDRLYTDSIPLPRATALLVITMDDAVGIVGMDRVAAAMKPARGFATDAFDRMNGRAK